MFKFKIVSSLEKAFVEESIDKFEALERISVLKGERFSLQLLYTYEEDENEFYQLRLRPEISGALAKYVTLHSVLNVPVIQPVTYNRIDDNYLRTTPGLYPDMLEPVHYNGEFRVRRGCLESLWLEFNIPEDCDAIGENALTIPANTSYYYIIYRAVNLYFEATGATGIKVVYGESEYTADANGKIDFALLGADTNSAEILFIENTTDAEITFAVEVNSAPGTYGNPIEIETVGEAIVTDPITKGTTLYYTYTATESGFFTVELSTAVAYISMQNTRNSNSVNSVSDAEDGKIKLIVNAGDVIKIDVSVISSTETVSVTFTPTLVTLEAITPVKKD